MRGGWLVLRVIAAAILVSAWTGHVARADDFTLPGLQSDSQQYAAGLAKRYPAGGTPQARRAAEQAAAAAAQRKDWAGVASALEQRVALGEPTHQQWHDLAAAQLRRTPPEAQKGLFAAWMDFVGSDAGDAEIPGLLLIADALRALDRPAQAAEALQAVIDRAPDNAGYKRLLADAQRATGMLVRRVATEPEADPPRACVQFTVPPTRAGDFNPQDWVRFDPPVPGVAVTREGDSLCLSGLPSGATTQATVRAGLPAEQGLTLAKDAPLSIAMADRRPRAVFDTRLFVLPRGQARAVTLTTVNLSGVSLKLMRLSERSLADFLRDVRLGDAVESYTADTIGDQTGRVVWEGKTDIPKWQPNKPAHTALPLPEPLLTAGPGLYALQVSPGDGTRDVDPAPAQMILRTDLAPTVWRGTDGLTVQVRSYADAHPVPGVKLRLVARNNDILAEAETDAQGVAKFAAPLLRGQGPAAPAAIHAFGPNEDFAALDLNAAAFDLADRGVEGAPFPGPLDAYVWLDRGIYRPGETVQAMALLRDDAGAPADIPATITVRRPNGLVMLKATPPRLGDASVHLPVPLSPTAAAGIYTIEVRADPDAAPIGTAQFRVDAFVPDRMAVDLGPLPASLAPGTAATLPVTARFLYGAPAAGLSGKATLRLMIDPASPAALPGYRVGLTDEAFAPDAQDLEMPDTDGQGRAALPVRIDQAPDTTHPLKAEIDVEVNDPSGHGSRATATLPVRAAGPMIGIKPAFDGDSIDAGTQAGFDIAAIDPAGRRIALPARLRLVKERPDWRMVVRGSVARYETVWRDEPLETRDISIAPGTPFRFSKTLDFGRYRLEVAQTGGLAATSVRFFSGWAEAADTPETPDRVDVSADRRVVPAGQSARIHIAPPFAGDATLLVLSGKVLALRNISVPAGGADVDVPVDASWGPGAYVAVHVFRAAAAGGRPGRAIGLTWVGVDPAARKLNVAIDAVDRYPPRAQAAIGVKTAPGAWVTLAAVDEGILRLTHFVSPDPAPHFLGQRTLGLDIRDDWGRLIPPADGEATLLRQGGDDGSFVLPEVPQHTVILFSPPVQAGPDGRAAIPLDLPDFNGQVRLMAVAWQGPRIGAASSDIIVRDALVAEPLLPRFLAPGDDTRLAVLLHSLDLPPGEAAVTVSTDGPLQVTGPARLAATLATGTQALPVTTLHAAGVGRGVIHLDVTGASGFHIRRETAILIRPARGAVTTVAGMELAPGADATLTGSGDRYLPGTWRAAATFGAPVRYDAAAVVQALVDYPLACLEQATSRGLPLTALQDGAVAGPDRAGRLQSAVSLVLDRQRYDGGFGLWSPSGEAEPWLSAYAMEFLLRARAAGAGVGDQAIADGLKYLADTLDDASDKPEGKAAQAYRLYVLALGGQARPGAARVMAEHVDDLPTPLAKAQLGAALALSHDSPRAEAAFAAALQAPARKWWSRDYGSTLRDQAAMVVLLKESGLLPDRLAGLQAALPGPDLAPASLSTQELAWEGIAAGVLGRTGQPAHLSVRGAELTAPLINVAITGPTPVRNLGSKPVWQSVSVTGVPIDPLPASRAGMRVQRRFFNLDGSTLDLDHLKQNTNFVLLIEGRAEDGQDHRAMVLQGLPAGWEIAARLNSGAVPGMSWLGELSETEAEPAADDRFAAVVPLTGDNPTFRVAVRLRAVTPGEYEIPGAELSDMYRPAIYARQTANRIKVAPVE